MHPHIPLIGWLLALVLLVPPALAQTMYKSTMPDGQVIYGDKPAPGAAKVEATKVAPATKGVTPPSAGEVKVLKQLEADRVGREAADNQLRAAEKALAEAEAALVAGREPREGERTGTAGGGSRLNDAYWQRQKAAESAVEEARRKLEEARGRK